MQSRAGKLIIVSGTSVPGWADVVDVYFFAAAAYGFGSRIV
jgi:hypothetical protein